MDNKPVSDERSLPDANDRQCVSQLSSNSDESKRLSLTAEKRKKLDQLDDELARKRAREARIESMYDSDRLGGIPISIVKNHNDILSYGRMFGVKLFKDDFSKTSQRHRSFIDMLNNPDSEPTYDFSSVPKYYSQYHTRMNTNSGYGEEQSAKGVDNTNQTNNGTKCLYRERDRINGHVETAKRACDEYQHYLSKEIDFELNEIQRLIGLTLSIEKQSAGKHEESFITSGQRMQEFKVLCENMLDALNESVVDDETEDDIVETLHQMKVFRNAICGFVQVGSYLEIAKINRDFQMSVNERTSGRLSGHFDKTFSALDDALTLNFDNDVVLNDADVRRMTRELITRCFTKAPDLKPFDFALIKQHCCVITLSVLPVYEVIWHGIVGPYNNNPIAALEVKPGRGDAYYLLKDIVGGGIRLWTMDDRLRTFCLKLRDVVYCTCTAIFRQIYGNVWKSKTIDESIVETLRQAVDRDKVTRHQQQPQNTIRSVGEESLINLIRSLRWLQRSENVENLCRKRISAVSRIVPTNVDFFDRFDHSDTDDLARRGAVADAAICSKYPLFDNDLDARYSLKLVLG